MGTGTLKIASQCGDGTCRGGLGRARLCRCARYRQLGSLRRLTRLPLP